jgi:hypothetical protein
MNSITAFFHHLFTPHCEHCLEERRELKAENKICESCETLRKQLEIANFEKERLLSRLLEKPEQPIVDNKPVNITPPKTIPWRVRQQMLEQADRDKAMALRNAAKPDVKVSTADLEKDFVEDNDAVHGSNA